MELNKKTEIEKKRKRLDELRLIRENRQKVIYLFKYSKIYKGFQSFDKFQYVTHPNSADDSDEGKTEAEKVMEAFDNLDLSKLNCLTYNIVIFKFYYFNYKI